MISAVALAQRAGATENAFPRWVRAQTYVRNTVVFAGSAIALIAVSLA